MNAQSALMQGPEATERFRIATNNQTIYRHTQKRCACGKVVTARQLAQYKCCDACFKAAAK